MEYETLCPVCGATLTLEEINKHICFQKKIPLSKPFELHELNTFETLFKDCVGEPRSIQKLWMKRLLRGESFAVTAPTGIGKTRFGLVASLFFSLKEKRSYLLFPTSLLVKQAYDLLSKFVSIIEKKHQKKPKIVAYFSDMKEKEKELVKKSISNGEFDILLTTTQFLTKNFSVVRNNTMDFIFVDDVDSLLKNSRNVEKILNLLGFRRINDKWSGEARGSLMVASATAKPGKSTMLFKELLGFDVGGSSFVLRDVYDIILRKKEVNSLEEILKKMETGGIIYTENTDIAEKLYEKLSKKGYKIGLVTAQDKRPFEDFKNKDLDFLIGTAHYYGSLIRGLDLPEIIKFVVFYGIPSFKVSIDKIPLGFLKQLILKFYDEESMSEFRELLNWKTEEDIDQELLNKAQERVKSLLLSKQNYLNDISIIGDTIVFPDLKTYIQGSGRTSRLMPWGLTKGASFVMEDNESIISAFINKAGYYGIDFQEYHEVDLELIKKELYVSRTPKLEKTDIIKPALFIVESPTKAKHIAHYFGRPSIKKKGSIIAYEVSNEKYLLMVTASLGHVTDLIIGKGYHGIKITDKKEFIPIYSPIYKCAQCGYQISMEIDKCPKCGSEEIISSKERINDLRSVAYETELVIIGTDPDSEGEKIAWDLQNLLSPIAKVTRAEFHEVTPKAIRTALSSLRSIDLDRVEAQVVRRIEDRWIGFILSQHLQERFNNKTLAAGRVQTPVLGWIIKQEQKSREKIRIYVIKDFDIELKPITEDNIKESVILELEIKEVKTEETTYSPLPPFTTDVMLQAATQKLGFSTAKTMDLAQKLFEAGLITYHRTDSTHVSDNGIKLAKAFLKEDFEGRSWGAAGTHECIRPTKPYPLTVIRQLIKEGIVPGEEINEEHLALYDLIFRRFMASQAKKFIVIEKHYIIEFEWGSAKQKINKKIAVHAEGRAHELYPYVKIRKELPVGKVRKIAKLESKPLAIPFNEAEIVNLMKQRGIGRPSTYAIIIDKLFQKNYIFKKNNRLFSTKLGKQIYEYLEQNFSHLISEERTRKLMEKMDLVEKGQVEPERLIEEIYQETKEI